MKSTRFLIATLICTGLITAGLTQAQITLDTSVPSPGTGSILVDQGGGVAAWEDAAGGGQGPQGKQGDPGPVGSEFWDGDIAGDIYKVNSGNVGIGTTTPTSLLHISGSEPSAIRMSGTRPTYGPRDYLFGLQAGNLNTGDPGMRLQTVDATAGLIRTILDAQGFFGIGDLTPAARLHVNESPNVAGSLGGQLFRITGHEPSMQIEATRNATTWNIGASMSGFEDNGMRLNIGNNHMGTAMTINQVGRIGIGTALPAGKLHIIADSGALLRLEGSEPAAILMSGTRGGYARDFLVNLSAGATSAGDPGMFLQTIDMTAEAVRTKLDSRGFLGIGDIAPAARLHVNESPNGAGELGGQLFRITGYEPSMQIEATRNATTWNIGANMSGTADNGMRLMIGNNHMGTAMAINQVGRVGIGQDLPAAKLHVQEVPENSGDQGLLLRLTGREPRMELEAQRTGVTWSLAANYTGGDQGMRLRIANSDSGPALTINQPGRVGIGTDVPTAKLEVVGDAFIGEASNGVKLDVLGNDGVVFRVSGHDNASSVFGRSGGLGTASIGTGGLALGGISYRLMVHGSHIPRTLGLNSDAGVETSIHFLDGGTERWKIYSDNDVASGEAGHKNLIFAKNGTTDLFSFTQGGDLTLRYLNTDGVNETSDERLKKNIQTVPAALDKVMQLRGVSFDWRDGLDSGLGVVAQEVEAVVPEMVHTGEDGYKSVKYSQISALLIEAVKEQQAHIEALEATVESLKANN